MRADRRGQSGGQAVAQKSRPPSNDSGSPAPDAGEPDRSINPFSESKPATYWIVSANIGSAHDAVALAALDVAAFDQQAVQPGVLQFALHLSANAAARAVGLERGSIHVVDNNTFSHLEGLKPNHMSRMTNVFLVSEARDRH